MKDMEKLKAKNVISLLLFVYFFIACSVVKVDNQASYTIDRKKSETGLSYIVLSYFELDNKSQKLPAFSYINGIILPSNFSKVLPNTIYDIEVSCYGYDSSFIKNLLVKKGDSLNVKVYMKESNFIHINYN